MMPLDLVNVLEVLNLSVCIPLFQSLDLLPEFVDLIKILILFFLVSSKLFLKSITHLLTLALKFVTSSFRLFQRVSIGLICISDVVYQVQFLCECD